ncbi:23S rRNA (uracil(1939)-C(5))-methyltransferase RlmD [Kiritimatiella glycovorans]|uniref:Putative RNA methyltransferase n=1 Tax=Kiritimatiella glycovorans TaxID=1307763 RepID=A0A0G3EBC7_9BACT|nr:23S rRNA (uracil(1939)-C(5))-methyltransferase RlmD [Kiritimatiella glycovorans]AKJ63796.1 putative RNA methyltransferase [Kiritimatiella glycovorans]
MFGKNDIVEVEITDTADRAQTFARLEDGRPVFVRGPAAVGDVVHARLIKLKKTHAQAVLTEVHRPSDRRTAPRCPHFGICGGCKWQHLEYAEQLRIKRKQVVDALEHLGGFSAPSVAKTLPAPRIYGYRNKIDLSFTDMRWVDDAERKELRDRGWDIESMSSQQARSFPAAEYGARPLHFALGFHAPGCYAKALDLDRCHLVSDELNTIRDCVRTFCLERDLQPYTTRTHEGFLRNLVLREGFHTGERMVNLVTSGYEASLMEELAGQLRGLGRAAPETFVNSVTRRKNTVALGEREHVIYGSGSIGDRLLGMPFRISAHSFFQTNTRQAETLYGEVHRAAGLEGGETVFDLYCGTGTIALTLAECAGRVVGFESVGPAVADARANAERLGITHARFIEADLNHPAAGVTGEKPDVLIADPPRAGMHPDTVATVREWRPERIVYVSCKPASLARDGAALCTDGAYRLEHVTPIDMFPQTDHIESVALFRKTP